MEDVSILTEKELATTLGISPWTIRNWRLNAGLPYFGTVGRIFYRKDAVLDWMKSEEARHATEAKEHRKELIPCPLK